MKVYKIKDLETGLYYTSSNYTRWNSIGKLYSKLGHVKQAFGDNGGLYTKEILKELPRRFRKTLPSINDLRIEIFELCPGGVMTVDDLLK